MYFYIMYIIFGGCVVADIVTVQAVRCCGDKSCYHGTTRERKDDHC